MTRELKAVREVTPCGLEGVAEDPAARAGSGVIVAHEPRHRPRIRKELSAQLSTVDANGDALYTLTAATTLDVADGGLGLAVDELITVGQRVVVEIELTDGQWVERNGRVAWTSEDPTGSRFVGIAFDAIVAGFATHAASAERIEL